MKRLFIALLITLLLPTLCSCAEQSGAGNILDNSFESQDPEIERDGDLLQMLEYEDYSRDWLSIDESGRKTFTKDYDGIVLTVTTDKSEYTSDEPIKIKAALKNNTDREIYVHTNTRASFPIYVRTNLSRNDISLIHGEYLEFECCDDLVETVAPGEELTDYTNYETYYYYNPSPYYEMPHESKVLAESGVYNGFCTIRLCSEAGYHNGCDITKYSIDFSVTLI